MSDWPTVDQIDDTDSTSRRQVVDFWRFACTNYQRSAIIGGPAPYFDGLLAVCDKRSPRLTNRQTFANHNESPASEVLTATHLTTTEKWAVQFRPGRFSLSTISHAESMAR